MNFNSWITDFQLYKQQTPKNQQEDYPTFVARRNRTIKSYGVIPIRLMTEDVWLNEQKPYYNIHPGIAAKLCKTNLSKIPSNMLQMPRGARAVNIRFAQQHNEFTIQEAITTDNEAHVGVKIGQMPPGSWCHGILMVDCREQPLKGISSSEKSVMFIMDFNVYTKDQQPIYSVLGIQPREGESLEEIMDLQCKKGRNESYSEILRNVIRLAVTIGFLADNPSLCEADILNKDRSKFINSSEENRQIIINRARRKGKNGFNVGADLMFLGRQPMQHRKSGSSTGRELTSAHIREGHPHAVRYGKNKELVKIKWFMPTVVRDDLPFNP